MPPNRLVIADLAAAARKKLDSDVWEYVDGGSGTEATVVRNDAAIRALAFMPRVLREVSNPETDVSFLGMSLSLPVIAAPIGGIAAIHQGGALEAARGAHAAGTVAFLGMHSAPGVSELRDSGVSFVAQIYAEGGRGWLSDLLERVIPPPCAGVCVTVDSPVKAARDRVDRIGFSPRSANSEPPNLPAGAHVAYRGRFDWGEFEWLRQRTALPLILKGIVSPRDAAQAVQAGADAIYVSNHGGRALDSCLSSMEALPGVVRAVAGAVPILVDGGFARGTDVVKALCLGATAVLVGRSQCHALAVGGESGLAAYFTALRTEIAETMAFLGVNKLNQLDSTLLSTGAAGPPIWWNGQHMEGQ